MAIERYRITYNSWQNYCNLSIDNVGAAVDETIGFQGWEKQWPLDYDNIRVALIHPTNWNNLHKVTIKLWVYR